MTQDAIDLNVDQDMDFTNITVVQIWAVVNDKNENVRRDKSVEDVPYRLKNHWVARGA